MTLKCDRLVPIKVRGFYLSRSGGCDSVHEGLLDETRIEDSGLAPAFLEIWLVSETGT